MLMMSHDAALCSQHVRGIHNVIADSLSRDFHLTDETLTTCLPILFPTQLQAPLSLIPKFPTEITCWIECLRVDTTSNLASPPTRSKSKMGALLGGNLSSSDAASQARTWMIMIHYSKYSSCPLTQELFTEICSV